MSQVAICNIAIATLGHELVSSMDEDVKAARLCNTFWDIQRDAALERFNWSFARKRATIAQLSTEPDFDWDYYYQLPADCLFPRKINSGDDVQWEVEGTYLACNETEVDLEYTYRCENTALWSSGFKVAMAKLLEASIAPGLLGSNRAKVPSILKEAENLFLIAMQTDAARMNNHPHSHLDPDNSFTFASGRE